MGNPGHDNRWNNKLNEIANIAVVNLRGINFHSYMYTLREIVERINLMLLIRRKSLPMKGICVLCVISVLLFFVNRKQKIVIKHTTCDYSLRSLCLPSNNILLLYIYPIVTVVEVRIIYVKCFTDDIYDIYIDAIYKTSTL